MRTYTSRLQIRLTPELHAGLAAEARLLRISTARLIRNICATHLRTVAR